jgi:protein-disulfide isomerase
VSEAKGSSPWLAAIVGGIIGSTLTAGAMLLAAPQLIGPKLVREGMLADPQILVDASDALRDQQYEPVLTAYRQALETPFGSSWKGAEKPDVVLVEFFDYACGYCRASNADIDRLLAEDKGLRVVYREFPILGEPSLAAAHLSLAASRAGRFRHYYDAQFAAGRPSPETAAAAARAANIPDQAGKDPAAEAEIRRNYQLAQQLGANATPLFIVGNKVLNGAVGYDGLKAAIADARSAQSRS